MILYATKQTIERFKIQIFEDIQSANKDLAKKVIEEQQNDELLEWGIKLFYFDGRKCIQAMNFSSKFTIFLFDIRVGNVDSLPEIIAHYLMDLYSDDRQMQKALRKLFAEYPLCVFSKLNNKSIISSLNHNQSYYAWDGELFYDYMENGILKTMKINKEVNWNYLVTQTVNEKKNYIYPAERFREIILERYKD